MTASESGETLATSASSVIAFSCKSFLLGRFSGRVLKSGEHLVPEAALEALADQNISFTVQGKTTYEQQTAAIRDIAPASI